MAAGAVSEMGQSDQRASARPADLLRLRAEFSATLAAQRERGTMDFDLDDMPEELADRVRAATGRPDHLSVRHAGEWVVEALTGDRATVMRLALDEDGSVSEVASSFLLSAIEALDLGAEATVTVREAHQLVTLPVSDTFAQLLAARR